MTLDAAKSRDDRIFALIPCAGQGSRAGTGHPKQYQRLCGQAMVWHTLQAFRALGQNLTGLWVVLAPEDDYFVNACPDFGAANEVLLRRGGATRAATVRRGLQAMQGASQGDDAPASAATARPTDWVLVHDAARCLITPAQILALISACEHDAVGGLLAQKLPDTLKVGACGRVASTLDRSDKWLAQTPQMFRIGPLLAALKAAGDAVTDESGAIEAAGLAPQLVPASAQNFKVTYPEDFALAEAILTSRSISSNRSTDLPSLERPV